ncbi:MAG: hypothetical protein WAM78_00795 [Candidatus Sulfotelmatobacter sp.]
MKKSALLSAVLVFASIGLVSCGAASSYSSTPSKFTTRVLASQGVSSPTAAAGLVLIDGWIDTLGRGGVSAGNSPGLMAISPDRSVLLSFDSSSNKVYVTNTKTDASTGSIQLPGPTISLAIPVDSSAYAAVPSAPLIGSSPGAVVAMNLAAGGVAWTVNVPNAQRVVSNPSGTLLLVFSNDSDSVTVVSPQLVNTGNPVTVTVAGFDRPVNAVYSSDGSTAYILNCGAQCGGQHASVQVLDFSTTPPTPGAKVLVNGATDAYLSGSTLYVAGLGTPTGPLCASIPSAATTAAQYCGYLDIVNLNTMQDPYYNNPTSEIAITNGYHDRMDLSSNGQLFVGSYGCTSVGDVNATPQQGEIRGCLAIYNTTNGAVVMPPDNGDVTGLQSFSTRYVEYVAEGGNLRVYDTTIDSLLINQYIETGTITVTGQVIDIRAIDFF